MGRGSRFSSCSCLTCPQAGQAFHFHLHPFFAEISSTSTSILSLPSSSYLIKIPQNSSILPRVTCRHRTAQAAAGKVLHTIFIIFIPVTVQSSLPSTCRIPGAYCSPYPIPRKALSSLSPFIFSPAHFPPMRMFLHPISKK
jgi:hypothetical protein